MDKLVAMTPCAGLLPVAAGSCSLTERMPEAITSLAPYAGKEKAASEALKAAHGMGFPGPGRMTGRDSARAIWSGLGQALLVGPAPGKGMTRAMALTDQSDAWAVMRLEGEEAEAVLARLTPLDVRVSEFRRGSAARTELFHMAALIARVGVTTFDIMVFRSMAATAVHDLEVAMKSVAAQAGDDTA